MSGLAPLRLVLRQVQALDGTAATSSTGAGLLWRALRADIAERLIPEVAPKLVEFCIERLRTQGGFVLLDGLDEVPAAGARRERLREAVQDLINAGQRDRFVDHWYNAVRASLKLDAARATERASSLKAAVAKWPHLRDLAQRPLLLTLMATLHSSWGDLPEDRADLYEESVDLLLSRWQEARMVNAEDGTLAGEPGIAEVLGLDKRALRRALQNLALTAHTRQRSTDDGVDRPADIGRGDLLLAFEPLLGAGVAPEPLFAYLRDHAGILTARDDQTFSFPHRSFQEYLAASQLADRTRCPRSGEFRPRLVARALSAGHR